MHVKKIGLKSFLLNPISKGLPDFPTRWPIILSRRSGRDHCGLEKSCPLSHCLEGMAHSVVEDGNGTGSDEDFHQILAEASGNHFLRDFMRFLNGKLRGLIQRARTHSSQQPSLPMMVQEEHVAIFEAISKRDPERARDATLAHIKNAAKRLGFTLFDLG